MRLTLLLFIIFSSGISLFGQKVANTPEEFEKQYNINIRKSRINGYYIPKNFDEAVQEFRRLSPPSSVEKFKTADEDLVVKKLHFGLGKWLAANWSFYEGSRFSHMLRMKGVSDPNDMIQVTLRTIHRSLNEKELDLEGQIIKIRELQKKEHEERLKSRQIIDQKTVKIDTIKP
jgi:hypothetical protein